MITYPTYLLILAASVFGVLIVLLGGASWLWNKRYRNYRIQQQGRPTDNFGRIMSRTMRFITKEETGSIFQKAPKDASEQPKPVSPALAKVTYKKVYLGLLLASLVFALLAYFIPFLGLLSVAGALILLLTVWGRTAPIFTSRHKVLTRMFDVAQSQFKYGKGSEMDPWSYINVTKWENLIIPADTVISIPNTYRSDLMGNRDNFEGHFSNIVTDDNSWDYEWNSVKNQVIAHPVRHLPKEAPYPGSEQYPWNVFPIGEGVAGPVTFDVSQVPHTLVAGPTGSGKSVLQLGLLLHCIQHNDVWRFVGIDLKRVELSRYRKYKKTVKAIAVDLETGVELTRQIKDTMMERYTIMENAGVNHFLQLKDENGQHPKAIMLMVDEAFVFLSPEGAKTDEGKQRDQWHGEAVTILGEIARLGRAAGIHLIIATQRPDAAVIPGELRSNLENRIAAGRLNTTSSAMILDSGAGTRLPKIKGRGAISISGEVQTFQGYFATAKWIDEWLENHKDREPSLFGLPDTEDDVFGEESDGVDFLPDDQLEFDMDEAAQRLLMNDANMKPEFPEMLPNGELPEGPDVNYSRVTQPPKLTGPVQRRLAEAEEFSLLDDDDDELDFADNLPSLSDLDREEPAAKPVARTPRRVTTETIKPAPTAQPTPSSVAPQRATAEPAPTQPAAPTKLPTRPAPAPQMPQRPQAPQRPTRPFPGTFPGTAQK